MRSDAMKNHKARRQRVNYDQVAANMAIAAPLPIAFQRVVSLALV
jgi:hypothetical protein